MDYIITYNGILFERYQRANQAKRLKHLSYIIRIISIMSDANEREKGLIYGVLKRLKNCFSNREKDKQ